METLDFFCEGLIQNHSDFVVKDVLQTSMTTLIQNNKESINAALIERLDDIAFIEDKNEKSVVISDFFSEIVYSKNNPHEIEADDVVII